MTRAENHQVIVGENDEWSTPQLLVDEICEKYNIHPIYDVCTTTQNTKFDLHFTPENNALSQEWDDDFFMNPPYSQITLWMQKAYEQHLKYDVNALILVFAKTDTQWWHNYIENKAEVHFQKGRIRFLLNNIEPKRCKYCKIRYTKEITNCEICGKIVSKTSPTYGSAWVIYRKK